MGGDNTNKTLVRPNGAMKKCIVLSLVSSILLLCILNSWLKPLNMLMSTNANLKNVTILLWHWPFGKSYSLKGDVCWDLYSIPRCQLVDQRALFSSADVVVFHNRELISRTQKLPLDLPRPPHQRWAWLSLESPVHSGNLQKFAHVFNLTMTYRRDSDVTVPYGELLPKQTTGYPMEDHTLNKSSVVCWVVSNYKKHHKRTRVYRALNATIPVRVYGRWTKSHLSSEALLPTISRCYFYLAFENSMSKDYITEKLWRNAYGGGAVPVVLGPPLGDYVAVAPPHSFIHIDQFASVRELGEYLLQLAQDGERYRKYFSWKQNWTVKLYNDWRERLCRICSQYNDLPREKVYSDLMGWFNSNG